MFMICFIRVMNQKKCNNFPFVGRDWEAYGKQDEAVLSERRKSDDQTVSEWW